MRDRVKDGGAELLFLQLRQAAPEKKREFIEQFNRAHGFLPDALRSWKHADGIRCPGCGTNRDEDVVCNGKVRRGDDRQRYLCRACGCSFNDHTGTVFHRTKALEKWPLFLQCMLNGFSIRRAAAATNISPATAQAWRKKLLSHLAACQESDLAGIVEQEELVIKPSRKGEASSGAASPTLHSESTLVFCQGRKGGLFIGRKASWEQMVRDSLAPKLGRMIAEVSQPASSARAKAKKQLRELRLTPAIVEQFCKEYARMRGVNSRNLAGYAAWEQFRAITDNVKPKEKLHQLLRRCL